MTKVSNVLCVVVTLLVTVARLVVAPAAQAAPCLVVTLTGTSGPPPFNGLAGPGTPKSCTARSITRCAIFGSGHFRDR
jgi:hypothetical protein